MQLGGLEGYFRLAENYTTQSEPAFCALGTLAMVLNALNLDPMRVWKGVWRWWHEELFDCCKPLAMVKQTGINCSEFACLVQCSGAAAVHLPARHSSEAEFREHVRQATLRENLHLVIAFSRSVLGQTGDGHYSPIGAYHAERDMVLVMDVARFKYPSYWAPLSLLWAAMQPADPSTGEPRGYFLISTDPVLIRTAVAGSAAGSPLCAPRPIVPADSLVAVSASTDAAALCPVVCRAAMALTLSHGGGQLRIQSWRHLTRQFFATARFIVTIASPAGPMRDELLPYCSKATVACGAMPIERSVQTVDDVIAAVFTRLPMDLADAICRYGALLSSPTSHSQTPGAFGPQHAGPNHASGAAQCPPPSHWLRPRGPDRAPMDYLRSTAASGYSTASTVTRVDSGGAVRLAWTVDSDVNVTDGGEDVAAVLDAVRESDLFKHVRRVFAPLAQEQEQEQEQEQADAGSNSRHDRCGRPPAVAAQWLTRTNVAELATLLLLAAPSNVFAALPDNVLVALTATRALERLAKALRHEVVRTREQTRLLSDTCCQAAPV